MNRLEFSYKGKKIVIEEEHPDAVISVDGRPFKCHHHHLEDGKGLAMWMCDEAYFSSPDIRELARHFADYGYLFNDPDRIIVNDAGEVVRGGPHRHDDDPGGHPGHGPADPPRGRRPGSRGRGQ